MAGFHNAVENFGAMPILLYVLITRTTRDRAPLITARVETFLRDTLPAIAHRNGSEEVELGIVGDHVHVLVRLPVRPDLPRLVQCLKGDRKSTRLNSSHIPLSRMPS